MNAPPGDVPAAGGAAAVMAGSGGSAAVMAGAGGTVAPAGSASGGVVGQVPVHDPTLFTWPEGNPDGGTLQLCKAGHYVGSYTCRVQWPAALGAFFGDAGIGYTIDGPVDLTLNAGQSGEFLTVSGGTLKSTATGILALEATVVGQLNCQTGVFSGQLTNGTVSIPPFPPGGTFTGTLGASFDPKSGALDGNWTLIGGDTFQGATCAGPWNAAYQGP